MPATCKFTDHGCDVEMMKDMIATHESECPYRLVNCVDLVCLFLCFSIAVVLRRCFFIISYTFG